MEEKKKIIKKSGGKSSDLRNKSTRGTRSIKSVGTSKTSRS